MIKKSLLKAFQIIWKTAAGFAILVGLYLLSAWILSSIHIDGEPGNAEVTLYLQTNGVHTDIIVPASNELINWNIYFPHKNNRNSDSTYRYLALGLGDKEFYLETPTWGDLTIPTAFNAAFGLGSGVLHATYYREIKVDEQCISIQASKTQYQALIQYIQESLLLNAHGEYINIKTDALYGNSDAFYEAKWKYSMFHTCNTWVNNALQRAKLKACYWTPFDWGLFGVYQ